MTSEERERARVALFREYSGWPPAHLLRQLDAPQVTEATPEPEPRGDAIGIPKKRGRPRKVPPPDEAA